ncbi:MAG: VIT1/CCC1 transporter family protein [Candidatus Omnitrophica bacterium]|nr:VIT1/CCC1 transporter family protein [Candidatus Omnitrophota bacterium]
MEKKLKEKILPIQRNEITEYYVYKKLSFIVKEKKQSEILERIAKEEMTHYKFLKNLTGEELKPNKLKIFIYTTIAKIFGFNFGLKLMEGKEEIAQRVYEGIKEFSPQIDQILKDEKKHEHGLISLINEERLKYVSSMVLGLNDALVELSGALVGFTLALQRTKLVGIIGLITGIAASMSMSASEFLSTKHQDTDKSPVKASLYTGFAYILTVVILVLPYFLFKNIFFCLSLLIVNVILLILLFTFYISISKGLNFKKRFLEMAIISIGVSMVNFFIGLIVRKVFGIEF